MRRFILSLVILTIPFGAFADNWKDEGGKGRKHDRREFKEEYWDGNCKVERKMKENGDYKEKRKCKPDREYRERVEYVEVPPPRYVEVPPPEPVYRDRKPKVQIDLQIRN